jgi:hypothetical protein
MSELRIVGAGEISEPTGQHSLALQLKNRGQQSCRIFGYPSIRFRDRAGPIPFVIRHGGDQVVTSRSPVRVLVRPGRSAYAVLNKYRCDLGDLRAARTLRLALPGAPASENVTITVKPVGWIQYCGRGDPGSTVSVSPFEPSLAAAIGG